MRNFGGEFPYPGVLRARVRGTRLVLESRLEEITVLSSESQYRSRLAPLKAISKDLEEVSLSRPMQNLVDLIGTPLEA